MTVRISLFTSARAWWQWTWMPQSIEDIVDGSVGFSPGRATLLSHDGQTVTGLARGVRGRRASDFDRAIRFDRIHRIDPVPFIALVGAVRPRARRAAADVFRAGSGRLSEAASDDIRARLGEPTLEKILATEPGWMGALPEPAAQFKMQRDAVNVALEIAGFDRELALVNDHLPDEPQHFLDRLVRPNEDSVIIDDLEVFPGWNQLDPPLRPAGRVFEDVASGRRLTVLHANKNEIERASGVDLVYFVHDYRSVVLVQYKRLRRENHQLLLRIDSQLDDERDRMGLVEDEVRLPSTTPSTLLSHRLTDAVCFFKLCECEQPAAVSDLSRGKYVDLRTWRLMEAKSVQEGPKGGRYLRYDSVVRYFTNSAFAELVSEGWVGSTSDRFDTLLDYVFERYEAGKSVILGSLRLGRSFRRLPATRQQLSTQVIRT